MKQQFVKIPPVLVARAFNLGATALVSACFEGDSDVMPASWVCPLDYDKMSAVIDRTHYTRKLIEKAGRFALMIPGRAIAKETLFLGSYSKNDMPDKLEKSGAKFFKFEGFDMPMVEGCSAYAVIDVISEPHNQSTYDLFLGKAVAVWGDSRVLTDRAHWDFKPGTEDLKTIHYVSGGNFIEIGDGFEIKL